MAKSREKKRSAMAKGQKVKKVAKKSEEKEQRYPSRKRKQVERYFEPYPTRVSAPKNPTIEQGSGEKLRDIPNVHFKMSKRKIDDNLNVLHTILFGRNSNVKYVKRNILQFSGFVWAENEDKQKAKVKEKLQKCTKDKLLDFCQLFDIPVNKRVTKKEEASEKLLEFLESPYVSRDVVLEEKEQIGKKRKRTKEVKTTSGEATSDKEENKRQKTSSKSDKKNGSKQSAKSNKDDDGGESGAFLKNEHVKSKPLSRKKNSEKPTVLGEPKIKQKTSIVNKVSSTKSNKSTSKSNLKACSASQDESKGSARSKKVSFIEPTKKGSKFVAKERAVLSEKDSVKVSKRVTKSSKKSASKNGSDSAPHSTSKSVKRDNKKGHDKPSTEASKKKTTKPKLSAKEKGKRKVQGKALKGPSREDMLPVVADILKEVDFDVVTLADIMQQLESHFKLSLKDRKGEVKSIIEEVIDNMSDLEDIEEDEGTAADAEDADDNKGSDDNLEADMGVDPEEEKDPEDEEDPEDAKEGSDDGDSDK